MLDKHSSANAGSDRYSDTTRCNAKLGDPSFGAPPEAKQLIDAARADLEAAGFQTRSVEK